MSDRSAPVAGVLVGVDGSPATLGAVGWAAREAARRGLSLDLVQVLPPSSREPGELRSPSGRAHALLEQARLAALAVAPGVVVRLSVVDGVTGPALVAVASGARLVVVGARPGGGVADVTVGRTVAHVMGHASCPVVVVPPRWEPGTAGSGVVVGVDGSGEASGALAFAAEAADRLGEGLTVVAVAGRRGGRSEEEELRRVLAEAVAGVVQGRPGLVVREVVRRGSVSEELLAEVRAGAGLAVVGSRGRGAVGGALLGSTSQQLVRFAPCPVAVLPPAAATTSDHPEPTPAETRRSGVDDRPADLQARTQESTDVTGHHAEQGVVVCGVDGSSGSRHALQEAIRSAARRGARLTAVAVYEPPETWGAWTYGAAAAIPVLPDAETVREEELKAARALVDEVSEAMAAELTLPAIIVEARAGRPVEVLVGLSRGADELIVGHRGRGAFGSMVLGSVSLGCVLHASCPVTVVPEPASGEDR